MSSGAIAQFTDAQRVKDYLDIDIDNTDDDGMIRAIADGVNMAVARALMRNILTDTYTETRDGTGTPTLMLKNFPVTVVSSVQLVGPAPTASTPNTQTLVFGQDYTFTNFALKMYRGRWPKGIQNVQVTYTAGYATVPSDLAHAATKTAAVRYRELERLGQKSKTLAGETVSFDLDEFAPDAMAIIQRYMAGMNLVDELAGTL